MAIANSLLYFLLFFVYDLLYLLTLLNDPGPILLLELVQSDVLSESIIRLLIFIYFKVGDGLEFFGEEILSHGVVLGDLLFDLLFVRVVENG